MNKANNIILSLFLLFCTKVKTFQKLNKMKTNQTVKNKQMKPIACFFFYFFFKLTLGSLSLNLVGPGLISAHFFRQHFPELLDCWHFLTCETRVGRCCVTCAFDLHERSPAVRLPPIPGGAGTPSQLH